MSQRKTKFIALLSFGLLLCACARSGQDTFPVTIVGNEVYNAYDVKNTWVVRIPKATVDEIIRTDPKNPLALFVAATRGDAVLTKKLLQQGADPNHMTDFGHYPIHEAARGGHVEVLDLLLAAGAKVDARISPKGPNTPNQWAALHFAAYSGNSEIAMKLIAKGADVNAKDFWGMTPLHYAREQKHDALAALLQEKGAEE